jgi:N-acetylmuramoyl-L-alanine amidase
MTGGGKHMDKSLLKKTAIQSLALMIAVITFSYALKQYRVVTIAASDRNIEDSNSSSYDDKLTALENNQADTPEVKLTELQKITAGADPNILKKLGDSFLLIKKPQGDHLSIKLKDVYINKSIQLTITGIAGDNLNAEMFSRISNGKIFTGEPLFTEKSSKKTEDDGTVKDVVTRDYGEDICHGITITADQAADTKLFTDQVLIELDKVYAYIMYETEDYYFIALKKPSEVYDKILVIDAGHGGKDAGALSKGETYYEKNINLAILLDLKKLLDKENIKVYYTRTADDKVFLRPRAELANEVDCDYFISIHCNANSVSYPNGTEVLYYNNKFKGVRASILAKLFSDELGKTISLKDRGIIEKHPNDIFIMDKAKVPMILIEVGYLTNNNDMDYLSRQQNREEVAQGIYNGIMKAYNILPVDREIKKYAAAK